MRAGFRKRVEVGQDRSLAWPCSAFKYGSCSSVITLIFLTPFIIATTMIPTVGTTCVSRTTPEQSVLLRCGRLFSSMLLESIPRCFNTSWPIMGLSLMSPASAKKKDTFGRASGLTERCSRRRGTVHSRGKLNTWDSDFFSSTTWPVTGSIFFRSLTFSSTANHASREDTSD